MVSGIFDIPIITGCTMRVIKNILTTGVLLEPDFTPERINYFFNDAIPVCVCHTGFCAACPPGSATITES
jgi:hypothetical protein